jgi:hypothetical protein
LKLCLDAGVQVHREPFEGFGQARDQIAQPRDRVPGMDRRAGKTLMYVLERGRLSDRRRMQLSERRSKAAQRSLGTGCPRVSSCSATRRTRRVSWSVASAPGIVVVGSRGFNG